MDAEGDRENVVMELEGGESLSTVVGSALENSEKELDLSSEDMAWVDSCLVPDSDVPEGGNWDMLRDVLLDVLASHPNPAPPLLSCVVLEDEGREGLDGKEIREEEDWVGDAAKEFHFENAFQPTYKEGPREGGDVGLDDGFGFVLDVNEREPSVDEIFKVWELESLTEEDDFVTQLNKALKSVESVPPISTESLYETLPLIVDDVDMTRWKGTKDESVDELIAGIADLSLTQSNR